MTSQPLSSIVPCKIVLARPDEREHVHTTSVASLYNGQVIFVWSDCLQDLGVDFLVGSMVFV